MTANKIKQNKNPLGNIFFQNNSLHHLLLSTYYEQGLCKEEPWMQCGPQWGSPMPRRKKGTKGKYPLPWECIGGAIYSEERTEAGSGKVDWRPIDGKALEKSPPRQALVWLFSARVTYNLSSTLGFLIIKGEVLIIMLRHWVKTKTWNLWWNGMLKCPREGFRTLANFLNKL